MRGRKAAVDQSMEMCMAYEALAGEEGQMSVELAATLPVVLVVANSTLICPSSPASASQAMRISID